MKKQILVFVTAIIIFSCSDKKDHNQPAAPLEETPAVLDENSDLDFTSFNKRMYKDIVDKLFKEAVDKDDKLKSIIARIEDINTVKNDSLAQYQKYVRNNQNYWNTLNQYANQLSDTVLRSELAAMIDGLEERYTEQVSPLTTLSQQIENSERILNDQVILVKILVTQPMMGNYQRNEYPSVNTLKSVKDGFDSLSKDLKPYATKRK